MDDDAAARRWALSADICGRTCGGELVSRNLTHTHTHRYIYTVCAHPFLDSSTSGPRHSALMAAKRPRSASRVARARGRRPVVAARRARARRRRGGRRAGAAAGRTTSRLGGGDGINDIRGARRARDQPVEVDGVLGDHRYIAARRRSYEYIGGQHRAAPTYRRLKRAGARGERAARALRVPVGLAGADADDHRERRGGDDRREQLHQGRLGAVHRGAAAGGQGARRAQGRVLQGRRGADEQRRVRGRQDQEARRWYI